MNPNLITGDYDAPCGCRLRWGGMRELCAEASRLWTAFGNARSEAGRERAMDGYLGHCAPLLQIARWGEDPPAPPANEPL